MYVQARAPTEQDLETDPLPPASLGRALAALHNLPETVFSSDRTALLHGDGCRDRNLSARRGRPPGRSTVPVEAAGRPPWRTYPWRFPSAPIHGTFRNAARPSSAARSSLIGGWTSAVVCAWTSRGFRPAHRTRSSSVSARPTAPRHRPACRAPNCQRIALVRWLVHGRGLLHRRRRPRDAHRRSIDLDGEPLTRARPRWIRLIDGPPPPRPIPFPPRLLPGRHLRLSPGQVEGPGRCGHKDEAGQARRRSPCRAHRPARKLFEGEVDPATYRAPAPGPRRDAHPISSPVAAATAQPAQARRRTHPPPTQDARITPGPVGRSA